MIGNTLPSPSVRSSCCGSKIVMTLRPCCAKDLDPNRPTVPCLGCGGKQEIIGWCSYCGKEQPQVYADYPAAKMASEFWHQHSRRPSRATASKEPRR